MYLCQTSICSRSTTIYSDKFGSYVSANERHTLANAALLEKQNYNHRWVNHWENFVNPINGAHTQGIEGLWEVKVKMRLKAMRGYPKELIPGYLDEVLWRLWFLPRRARVVYTTSCMSGWTLTRHAGRSRMLAECQAAT